jgi:hypothetical protein
MTHGGTKCLEIPGLGPAGETQLRHDTLHLVAAWPGPFGLLQFAHFG